LPESVILDVVASLSPPSGTVAIWSRGLRYALARAGVLPVARTYDGQRWYVDDARLAEVIQQYLASREPAPAGR
jgi:hypothetical protein